MPSDHTPPKRRHRRGLRRGVLSLAVLGLLGGVAFYLLAVRPARQSTPYRQAMERLRANRSAARLLGAPIEASWRVRGTVEADSAALAVPVSGSEREGVLHVEAQEAGGAWVFSRLELTFDEASLRVSLLDEPPRRGQRERTPKPLDIPPRYRE